MALAYLLVSLSILSIYIVELILPSSILNSFTVLGQYIQSGLVADALLSLPIIIVTYLVIRYSFRQRLITTITISGNLLKILLILSTFRLYMAISTLSVSTSLTRGAVQAQEAISNPIVLISKALALLYPYILVVILVSLFQTINSQFPLKKGKTPIRLIIYLFTRQKLYLMTIVSFISASILFDLARSSRGSFFLTLGSFIIAYCISPLFQVHLKLTRSLLISLFLIIILTLSAITVLTGLSLNRHYRDCRQVKCDTDYQSILTLLHDSSLIKVVGGQMVTAQALSGKLILAKSTELAYQSNARDYVKSINYSTSDVLDKFCSRTSCLSLIQPLSLVARYAGFDTPSLYYLVIGQYPYNSTAHIAASIIAFPFPISLLMYLLPIYCFCTLASSRRPQSLFPQITLAMFIIFLFTDNYLFSYQGSVSVILYALPVSFYKKLGLTLS